MSIDVRRSGSLLAAIVAVSISASAPARGDDFRIETKVFAAGQAKPAGENLTLFQGGTVYDFERFSGEVTILEVDPGRSRFVVLNTIREQKVEIPLSEIAARTANYREAGATSSDARPFAKFMLDPKFSDSWDAATKTLTLDGQFIRYKLSTEPIASPQANSQYRLFGDWFAQLNAFTPRATMPPFPRLYLNAMLAKGQQVPVEVTRTLKGLGPDGKDVTAVSKHVTQWRLTDADQAQIKRANEQITKFKTVSLEVFFQFDAAGPPRKR